MASLEFARTPTNARVGSDTLTSPNAPSTVQRNENAEAWLADSFSNLVEHARIRWLTLPEGATFMYRGAKRAVDIIYDAVGPVGPPVRPEAGSLFIVDERRLSTWRDDGYDYEPMPRSERERPQAGIRYSDGSIYGSRASFHRAGPVGLEGSASSYTDTLTLTFLHSGPSLSLSMSSPSNTDFLEQTVVLEWGLVSLPGGVWLQRRAVRLPRVGTGGSGAQDKHTADAGWIWLVQYLDDKSAPVYTPEGIPSQLGNQPPFDPSADFRRALDSIRSPIRGAQQASTTTSMPLEMPSPLPLPVQVEPKLATTIVRAVVSSPPVPAPLPVYAHAPLPPSSASIEEDEIFAALQAEEMDEEEDLTSLGAFLNQASHSVVASRRADEGLFSPAGVTRTGHGMEEMSEEGDFAPPSVARRPAAVLNPNQRDFARQRRAAIELKAQRVAMANALATRGADDEAHEEEGDNDVAAEVDEETGEDEEAPQVALALPKRPPPSVPYTHAPPAPAPKAATSPGVSRIPILATDKRPAGMSPPRAHLPRPSASTTSPPASSFRELVITPSAHAQYSASAQAAAAHDDGDGNERYKEPMHRGYTEQHRRLVDLQKQVDEAVAATKQQLGGPLPPPRQPQRSRQVSPAKPVPAAEPVAEIRRGTREDREEEREKDDGRGDWRVRDSRGLRRQDRERSTHRDRSRPRRASREHRRSSRRSSRDDSMSSSSSVVSRDRHGRRRRSVEGRGEREGRTRRRERSRSDHPAQSHSRSRTHSRAPASLVQPMALVNVNGRLVQVPLMPGQSMLSQAQAHVMPPPVPSMGGGVSSSLQAEATALLAMQAQRVRAVQERAREPAPMHGLRGSMVRVGLGMGVQRSDYGPVTASGYTSLNSSMLGYGGVQGHGLGHMQQQGLYGHQSAGPYGPRFGPHGGQGQWQVSPTYPQPYGQDPVHAPLQYQGQQAGPYGQHLQHQQEQQPVHRQVIPAETLPGQPVPGPYGITPQADEQAEEVQQQEENMPRPEHEQYEEQLKAYAQHGQPHGDAPTTGTEQSVAVASPPLPAARARAVAAQARQADAADGEQGVEDEHESAPPSASSPLAKSGAKKRPTGAAGRAAIRFANDGDGIVSLEGKFAPFAACAQGLVAILLAWRVRAVLRLKRVRTLVASISETRKLLAELNQGEGGEGGAFLTSVTAQLEGSLNELSVLMADRAERGSVELSTFLATQLKSRKTAKKSLSTPLLALALDEEADSAAAAKGARRAADRKSHLKGGVLGRAVLSKYGKVSGRGESEGGDDVVGTGETAPSPADVQPSSSAPQEKPWMKARKRTAGSIGGESMDENSDVLIVEKKKPAGGPGGGGKPPAGSKAAGSGLGGDDKSFGSDLKPSGKWRVVVEVVSGKNLAPGMYAPGTLAAGPGLKAEAPLDPSSLALSPDARDTYALCYLIKHLGVQGGCAAGVSTEDEKDKVKVIGKKLQTETHAKSLSPEWQKRFVFTLPTRTGLPDELFMDPGEDIEETLTSLCGASPALGGWEVRVDILDSDRFTRDTAMGRAMVQLDRMPSNEGRLAWLTLHAASAGDRVRGSVCVRYRLMPPDSALRRAALREELEGHGTGATGKRGLRVGLDGRTNGYPEESSPAYDKGEEEGLGFLKRRSQNPKSHSVDWSHVQPKTRSREESAGRTGTGGDSARSRASGRASGSAVSQQRPGGAVRMYKIPDYTRVRGRVASQAGMSGSVIASAEQSRGRESMGSVGSLVRYGAGHGYAAQAYEKMRPGPAALAASFRRRDLEEEALAARYGTAKGSIPVPRAAGKGGYRRFISEEEAEDDDSGPRGGKAVGYSGGAAPAARGAMQRQNTAGFAFSQAAVEYDGAGSHADDRLWLRAADMGKGGGSGEGVQSQVLPPRPGAHTSVTGPVGGTRPPAAAVGSRIPVRALSGRGSPEPPPPRPTLSSYATATWGERRDGKGKDVMESVAASIDRFFAVEGGGASVGQAARTDITAASGYAPLPPSTTSSSPRSWGTSTHAQMQGQAARVAGGDTASYVAQQAAAAVQQRTGTGLSVAPTSTPVTGLAIAVPRPPPPSATSAAMMDNLSPELRSLLMSARAAVAAGSGSGGLTASSLVPAATARAAATGAALAGLDAELAREAARFAEQLRKSVK